MFSVVVFVVVIVGLANSQPSTGTAPQTSIVGGCGSTQYPYICRKCESCRATAGADCTATCDWPTSSSPPACTNCRNSDTVDCSAACSSTSSSSPASGTSVQVTPTTTAVVGGCGGTQYPFICRKCESCRATSGADCTATCDWPTASSPPACTSCRNSDTVDCTAACTAAASSASSSIIPVSLLSLLLSCVFN
jgi:hypothetical protein